MLFPILRLSESHRRNHTVSGQNRSRTRRHHARGLHRSIPLRCGVFALALLLPGLFSLALAVILSPSLVHAQPSYTYEAFHSRFQVRTDGTVLVQHRVTYRFRDTSGWVGITIPADLGKVEEARVLLGGGEALPEGSWELERGDDGVILWFNPSNATDPATVIYEYVVSGALRVEGERVFLRWPGVPGECSSPIPASSVTVELPASVPSGGLQLEVETFDYQGRIQKRVVGDRQGIAELQELESGSSYEFTASWPVEIMDLGGPGFPSRETPAEGETPESQGNWEFERFDVDITLHPDATFTVRETQVVRFQGSFSYLTRDIPARLPEFEEGRTYGRVRLRDFAIYDLDGEPLDPGSWRVEDTGEGKRVTISFQAADRTLGWTIEYRVSGAVIFAPQRDRLLWNAVSSLREANIASSRVTVRLPEGGDPGEVETALYLDRDAPPREWAHGREGGLLWWEMVDVSPFTTFTLDVAFPKGLVAVPWTFRRTAAGVGIASSATILLLALAVMTVLWRRKGKGSRRGRRARSDPPQGLPPALVGMLVRQKTDPRDVTATVVDLARRGYLAILEEERRDIIRRRVFGFQRLERDPSGLLAYEKEMLESLFLSGERVNEEDLGDGLSGRFQDIRESILGEAIDRGYFPRRPFRLRRTCLLAGGGLICLSVALSLLLPRWFDLGWLWVPVLAPVPAGLIVGAVGRVMPRRTRAGSRAYGEVLGFRKYLEGAERPEGGGTTSEHFEANLPYALVLGVVEQWAAGFEGLYQRSPEWLRTIEPLQGPVSLGKALESLSESLCRKMSSRPSPGN